VTPGGFVDAAPVPSGAGGYDVRRRSTTPSTAPAGTTGFRVVVVPPTGGVLPVWAIKVNFGSVAADFSDDYSATVLAATVTEQSLAIVDLENQQALAAWQVVAAASGGKPARIGLASSTLGSYVALDAPFIFWGDNTVFDDATDTLQTTVGGRIRVMALGEPFGLAGNLLEWWGPTGVALSAMTTTNGENGRMTTAPYVFDNVVSGSTRRSLVTVSDRLVGTAWTLMADYTIAGVVAGPNGVVVSAMFDMTTFLFFPSSPGVTDFLGEMQLREMAPEGGGSSVLTTRTFSSAANSAVSALAVGSRTGAARYQVWMRSMQASETATIGGKVDFQAVPNS